MEWKYLIPLEKLNERSLFVIERVVSIGIIILNFTNVVSNIVYGIMDQKYLILHHIDQALFIAVSIQYILGLFFHGKAVITIYLVTKVIPHASVNLRTMALHFISLFLLLIDVISIIYF